MVTKKTTTKETTKKTTAKKPVAAKKVEVIEEVEVVEVKRKTKKELKSELKKLKNDIELEIMNLSSGRVVFVGKDGDKVFELEGNGDIDTIDLEDAYKISVKNKAYFEKHFISIVDTDSDEYDIEDIIEYLGLTKIYENIENYDTDYVGEILEMDNYDFEKMVKTSDRALVERLAERAKDLFRKGKFDSTSKARLISEVLNIEDLFDLI